MPHLGIAQPAVTQLSWPHSYNTPGVSVALEQVQRIELERLIEQQLDVVEQKQIAVGMLVCQLAQDDRRLEHALPGRQHGQPPPQGAADVQYFGATPFGQTSEQCGLPAVWAPNQ